MLGGREAGPRFHELPRELYLERMSLAVMPPTAMPIISRSIDMGRLICVVVVVIVAVCSLVTSLVISL